MNKNNIDNVSLSIGGGNNNNISENKFNIEDNSVHDNIINIVNGNTINVPDKIDRPCLEKYYNERKNSHGKTRIYRFYGYLTGATRIVKLKGKTLTKVLNVITSDGVYVDDHIWLDTQPKKYMKEYNNQRKEKGTLTGFVEFEGYIDSYIRQNGTVSSEIKIVSPITFHKDQLLT